MDPALLAEIVDTSADLVCLADPDLRVLFLNRAGRRALRVPEDEDVRGTFLRDYRSPAAHDAWAVEALAGAREHGHWRGETAWRTRDGQDLASRETLTVHRRGGAGDEILSLIARDLVEEKAADQARHVSLQLNQDIIRSVKEGVVVYDRELRYRLWNPYMEELSGIPADTVLGKRAIEMFPYLKEQGLDKLIERALQGEMVRGPDLYYSAIITGRSGWGVSHFSPLTDGKGEITGVVATIQDITDRKCAEEELRAREERYRLVFQDASDGLFLFPLGEGNVAGTFADVNDAACRMLGYSREDLLRRTPADLQPPDARTRGLLGELHRAGRVIFEWTLVRSDGTPVQTEISAHLIDLTQPPLVLAIVRDVTERRWAEEALRRSEARFRAVSEASPVGIFITDPVGGGVYMNRVAQDICGLSADEAKGRGWEASIHPEDLAQVAYEWDAAVSVGRAYKLVHRLLRPGGDTAWVSVQSAPILDGGRLLGHVGTIEDVTERRRHEAHLRQNETRLRLLVSQLPAILWTVDPDLRFTSSAGAGHALLGLEPNQLVGTSLFEYFGTDDPAFPPIDAHRRALQGESVRYGLDWQGRTFETVVEPFHAEHGAVAGAIGVAMDVTARIQAEQAHRESEERYRSLVDQASDGIFIGDAEGRYHEVNLAGLAMLGFSREEILQRPVGSLIAAEDRPRLEPAVRQVLAGKRVLTEWRFKRKDGSFVPTEVSAKRLPDGRIQAIVRDISDRKRTEEALRTLSHRLLHAQEEERRRIARELHDEVGQVLTAVKIQIQALSRSDQADERSARLQECVEGVDRAIRQVRDLSLALRPSLLDDLGLAAALRWYVDRQARDAGFRAELHIDKETPRLAPEVETACFRMVQEALTNVLRHSGAHKVAVTVRLVGPTVEIEVRDDGRGFDPAAVQIRAAAGECVGLSGMAERVSLVGGRLTIESAPGEGTLVRAQFPVLDAESRTA